MHPHIHLGELGGVGLYETGNGIRVNLQGAEEDKGEMCHVRCGGGSVLY